MTRQHDARVTKVRLNAERGKALGQFSRGRERHKPQILHLLLLKNPTRSLNPATKVAGASADKRVFSPGNEHRPDPDLSGCAGASCYAVIISDIGLTCQRHKRNDYEQVN